MNKALFVAWRSGQHVHQGWGPVGRLDFDGSVYRFSYTRGAQKLAGFQPFALMEDFEKTYESTTLFPLFANRLLSKSRPEYSAFLEWGGFTADDAPDPIAILSVTEGIRQTDQIEVFPCPVPDADQCYFSKFFVHGIRWMDESSLHRIKRLQSGEKLFLMLDICNEHDVNAVALRTEKNQAMVGYVPRYLARDVRRLTQDCEEQYLEVSVDRVNEDAPLRHRILCRMKACWPDGFEPCSGEEFLPIPSGVPERC